jgi:hypothetical protein
LAVLLIGVAAITVVGLYGDNVRDVFATSDNALAGSENALAAGEQAEEQGHAGVGQNQAAATEGNRASDGAGLAFNGSVSGPSHDKETVREYGDNPEGPDGPEVKVSYEIWSQDAAAVQLLGDSENGLALGTFHGNASVYGAYQDGTLKAGAEVGVEANLLEGNLTGTIGDENELYGQGNATVKVGSVGANAGGQLVVGREGVSAEVEAGVEANLVEGSVGVEGGFRIPFTNWMITGGAEATGSVGVGAKAHGEVTAGSEGFNVSFGAKLIAGLGGALDFSFGVKRVN